MEDFVKCLACKTESTKNDVFLDLPLAIKQFGIVQAYKSVVSFYTVFCFMCYYLSLDCLHLQELTDNFR